VTNKLVESFLIFGAELMSSGAGLVTNSTNKQFHADGFAILGFWAFLLV